MIIGAICYTVLASFDLKIAGLHPIVPSLVLNLLAFYIGNQFGDRAPTQQPVSASTK
jgi:sodium/pantothenate symporter